MEKLFPHINLNVLSVFKEEKNQKYIESGAKKMVGIIFSKTPSYFTNDMTGS